MFPTKELFYGSAIAMIHGLKEEFKAGLRPRDLVFCALDPRGDVHICVPKRLRDVKGLKVGEKLGLPPVFEGRRYYLDAVHPVGGDAVVINGDRRIGNISSLVDVAALVSWFVKEAGDKSIFFGCTSHQPGSWWVSGEQAIALHTKGFVEIVVAEQGLLARRTMDDGLFFLPREAAGQGGVEQWQRVFTSPLGNVLMLERRLLYDHLVLSCQGGLVEVDLYDLPNVSEAGRFTLPGGFAVVGRITGGAFAVARGTPMDWGFEDLEPAQLVGSMGCSFMELREQLRAQVKTP